LIGRFGAAVPDFVGSFSTDTATATEYFRKGTELLSALPPKPHRTAEEQALADRMNSCCRAARRRFLRQHGTALYDFLTDDGKRNVRVSALVFECAEHCPGLVPTRAMMESENAVMQRDKEGYEIDQGILVGHFLRSPRTGNHLIHSMLRPTEAARGRLSAFRSSGFVDLGTVTVERIGRMAVLTVSNDRFLNAEDNRTVADLELAVDLALLDDEVDVGVLRGGPVSHPRYRGRRIFSAGINLTDLYHGRISLVDFMLRRELGPIHKMMRGLVLGEGEGDGDGDVVTAEKPWIAVVDAFAIGGGMQMLFQLDRVIAVKGSYLSLPALVEGIIPGLANLRLTRLAGARLTRRLIYSGERIHTDQAEGALFCDRVLDESEINAELEAAAARLAQPAVVANRRMLLQALEPLDHYRDYLAQYAEAQANLLHSEAMVRNLENTWIHRKRP